MGELIETEKFYLSNTFFVPSPNQDENFENFENDETVKPEPNKEMALNGTNEAIFNQKEGSNDKKCIGMITLWGEMKKFKTYYK